MESSECMDRTFDRSNTGHRNKSGRRNLFCCGRKKIGIDPARIDRNLFRRTTSVHQIFFHVIRNGDDPVRGPEHVCIRITELLPDMVCIRIEAMKMYDEWDTRFGAAIHRTRPHQSVLGKDNINFLFLQILNDPVRKQIVFRKAKKIAAHFPKQARNQSLFQNGLSVDLNEGQPGSINVKNIFRKPLDLISDKGFGIGVQVGSHHANVQTLFQPNRSRGERFFVRTIQTARACSRRQFPWTVFWRNGCGKAGSPMVWNSAPERPSVRLPSA